MVDVRRQSQVCITAALVCGEDKLSVVYLELHEAEARCLVAFRTGLAQEEDIVLAVPFLFVDFLNQPWQFLKISRVAVYKDRARNSPTS